jgi:co-chaperonin GroES (HSP10)
MIDFEPISQYVWVKATAEEAPSEMQTKSGLFVPTTKADTLQVTGEVAGIGLLCDEKVQKVLRVGDTILLEGTPAKPITVKSKKYLLIIDRNVMAKI